MEGKSAFDSFLEIYHKLRIAESEFNSSKSVRNFFMKRETLPYPINIGIVSGGDWVDHVIDQLTVQVWLSSCFLFGADACCDFSKFCFFLSLEVVSSSFFFV